jgi:4-amino-4-deoxy-L-arabinose transferase-like glycosyltransferase
MRIEKSDRYVIIAMLVVGLSLALLGQYAITYRRWEWPISGVGLLLAGAGLVALVALAARPPRPIVAWLSSSRVLEKTRLGVIVAVVVALGLVAWATFLVHWRASRYGIVLWMTGLSMAVVALWRPSGKRRRLRSVQIDGWEVILVASLVAVALVVRLVDLGDFPRPMSGDEGSMALEAEAILDGLWRNPFGTGWFSHPSFYFYLLAASLRVFGWSLFALRLPSALFGSLGVAAVYLLGRNLFGRWTALVAALFLVGWTLPLHMSRLALNNSADVFFAALVMAFLHRGLVRGDRWAFVAAGLALGLGLHFYFALRLLVVLVPMMAVLGGQKRLLRRWRGLLALVFVALLAFAPLGVHFLLHPHDFAARMATDGLFQTGQLDLEHAATGSSRLVLFVEHLVRAAAAFFFSLDRGFFYTDTAPMLLVVSGALFVIGVELAFFQVRQPRYLSLLIWLGVVVFASGGLVRSPPGYHRYLVAAPAVCLLVGRTAVVLVRWLTRSLALPRVMRYGLLVSLAVILAFSGVRYYFAVYAPSENFSDQNTEIADRAAQLMVAAGPSYRTYFLGVPMMRLGGFNSVRFLAPQADWEDVVGGMPKSWMEDLSHHGVFFIALPDRLTTLVQIRDVCPVGEYDLTVGRRDEVLFYTYRLPPGTVCP